MSYANKFLTTGSNDPTDGTLNLYGAKIGAKNLISTYNTVKIDSSGNLFAGELNSNDITGVVANPMTEDLNLNNNNIINANSVCIGNATPIEKLQLGSGTNTANVGARIDAAFIGSWTDSNFATFSHYSQKGGANYALLQSTNGSTFVNGSTTGFLSLRIGNNEKMLLNSTGIKSLSNIDNDDNSIDNVEAITSQRVVCPDGGIGKIENLCALSEKFQTWTLFGVSVLDDTVIGPSGKQNASKITVNTTGLGMRLNTPDVNVNTTYTVSFWCKKIVGIGNQRIGVDLGDGTAVATDILTTDWRRFAANVTCGPTNQWIDLIFSTNFAINDEVSIFGVQINNDTTNLNPVYTNTIGTVYTGDDYGVQGRLIRSTEDIKSVNLYTTEVYSTNLTGTLQTPSQINITKVGTLDNLEVNDYIYTNGNLTTNLGGEGQIINYIPYSEDTSQWINPFNEITVIGNTTAPDGTESAIELNVNNTGSSNVSIETPNISQLSFGETYRITFYHKMISGYSGVNTQRITIYLGGVSVLNPQVSTDWVRSSVVASAGPNGLVQIKFQTNFVAGNRISLWGIQLLPVSESPYVDSVFHPYTITTKVPIIYNSIGKTLTRKTYGNVKCNNQIVIPGASIAVTPLWTSLTYGISPTLTFSSSPTQTVPRPDGLSNGTIAQEDFYIEAQSTWLENKLPGQGHFWRIEGTLTKTAQNQTGYIDFRIANLGGTSSFSLEQSNYFGGGVLTHNFNILFYTIADDLSIPGYDGNAQGYNFQIHKDSGIGIDNLTVNSITRVSLGTES